MRPGDGLGRRVLRRLLAAVLAVLVGAAGALALYYTSLQPGEKHKYTFSVDLVPVRAFPERKRN